MKPIIFVCTEEFPWSAEAVAEHFLEVARWSDFKGFGPIPGIRSATYEIRTPDVVGSRIIVTNRDGSTHVEEILEWNPKSRLRMKMGEFSGPLAKLATSIVETWTLERTGNGSKVSRSFELNPASWITMPILWMISCFLKLAVARHLAQMKYADMHPKH